MFNLLRNFLTAEKAWAWATGGGALSVWAALTVFVEHQPFWAGALFVLGIIAVGTAAASFFLGVPKGRGLPRYILLRNLPIRRISWGLEGLGIETKDGEVRVPNFHCTFLVNRRPINPKRFFLEFDSGKVVPLRIVHEQINDLAEEIGQIRPGQRLSGDCSFRSDPGDPTTSPTVEQFFRKFGAFVLVFEHTEGTFKKRFSEWELRTDLARKIKYTFAMLGSVKQPVTLRRIG